MSKCLKCGKTLTFDEMGLYKKLINRGATEFTCKKCLAEYLRVTEETLDGKIEQFRRDGCTLFTKPE